MRFRINVEAIKSARRDKGMSQRDLAMTAGVSVGTVERMEKGVEGIAWNTVVEVASQLGLDPAEVFTIVVPNE